MSTSKPILRSLVLLVLVWGVSPAVAEVTFRLLGAVPSTELEGLHEPLPDRNYRHRPWVDADANWFVAKFSVNTDAFGFRCDQARTYGVPPNGAVDLLLVGDSQTFGQGVDFDESLAGTVIARAGADRVRVANAATGGHYLRNQFELVYWLTEHKDLKVKQYAILLTPYLLMAPRGLSRADVGADGRLYKGTVSRWKQLMVQVKTRTVLYAKLRDAARATVLPPEQESTMTNTFLSEFRTGPAEAQRTEALFEVMTSFVEWAKQRNSDVQLVYVPLTLEFEFDELREAAKAKGVNIDRESPYRAAAAVASKLGLPLHDLRPVISRLHSNGQELSLRGDLHYNGAVSVEAGSRAWELMRPLALARRANRSQGSEHKQ